MQIVLTASNIVLFFLGCQGVFLNGLKSKQLAFKASCLKTLDILFLLFLFWGEKQICCPDI